MASFFSGSFFRTETELVLPGPGCEPLATDFGYEPPGLGSSIYSLRSRFELLECWHRSEKHQAKACGALMAHFFAPKVTKFHRLVTRSSLSKLLNLPSDDLDESNVPRQ